MMPHSAAAPWGLGAGLRYGLLGLPLAFCALPLYVLMPNFYATQWGVSLAALGSLLLALRLFDAVLDPVIGHWVDRLAAGPFARLLAVLVGAGVLLALAFAALFHPQVTASYALPWAGVALAMTYLAYSLLTVAHQSWGARLGGDALQRSRIVIWREGLGLVGVVLASIVPALWGVTPTAWLMAASLLAGLWALSGAPRPQSERSLAAKVSAPLQAGPLLAPWKDRAFVRLLMVFALNGIATAVPATLVLFFIQDRLQSPPSMQGVFLGLYFTCAALFMPLWLRAVARLGLARSWLLGMLLSVLAFVGAAVVGAGDALLYGAVCVLSGLALGSDLALPAALLAGITARGTSAHGVYFGWWNFAAKLNLALAAGLTLPLLGWLGYTPGARRVRAMQIACRHSRWCIAWCLARSSCWPPPRCTTFSYKREKDPLMQRRTWIGALAVAAVATLAGCSTPTVTDYAAQRPLLNLRDYFNGTLDAYGVFTDRSGAVVKRFTVVMVCHWNGHEGVLDEAFSYSDGTQQRRVWRLTEQADGRFTGRADDVVGQAQGQQSGNAFHWNYTLALPVDGRVIDVQFDDWMFLMDERVMLNRAAMSKFGVHLGDVTLSFFKRKI